jgi:hypothetical protein
MKKELNKNYDLLKSLKSKLNDSTLILNPEIVRSIEDFESFEDMKFKDFIEVQRQRLNKFQSDLDETEKSIKEFKQQIKNKDIEIAKITTETESLDSKKLILEKEIEEKGIKTFLERINFYYGRLMGYKSQPITLENGKLYFKTSFKNYEEIDDISTSKEIGESEKKCLDAALLFAFIDLDNEYNSSSIDFVILDDPADGLYDDINLRKDAYNKTNLLNLIKEKCMNNYTQFLILTADRSYNDILDLSTTSVKFNKDLFGFDLQ